VSHAACSSSSGTSCRNLLLATRWTIVLSLIAFVGGGIVGLAAVHARLAKMPGAANGSPTYIELFQGTPLLMQLFLPSSARAVRHRRLAWVAAALALTLDQRLPDRDLARLRRIDPKGQWEASASLALSYIEQMRYVILPQALRIAVRRPSASLVQVIKGTALASIIGFVELTKAGTMITNATFKPFLVYSLVALIYFCLCFPLSWWAPRILEGRLNVAR
jgi:polar amino acid transport system permease protein